MEYNIRISAILDKYLPADGIGTPREKLRMDLHQEFLILLQESQDSLKISLEKRYK